LRLKQIKKYSIAFFNFFFILEDLIEGVTAPEMRLISFAIAKVEQILRRKKNQK
jgi:hypothetical protein